MLPALLFRDPAMAKKKSGSGPKKNFLGTEINKPLIMHLRWHIKNKHTIFQRFGVRTIIIIIIHLYFYS